MGGPQRGVYSWERNALSIVADRSTPIPGGGGTFTDFFDCDLDQGQIAFSGEGPSGYRGLFLTDTTGAINLVCDSNTQVPGGNGGTFSTLSRVALSDGRIVFWGQGGGQAGIYSDVGGQLGVIANLDTPVPGFPGQTFGGFGGVSIDDGVIAFSGLHAGGVLGLFSTHDGTLQKVLALGDVLDGRIVSDAFIGAQALDGDSIAMNVLFTDGTRGIYMATIPAPGVGVAAIPGVLCLASRRQRPVTRL